MTIPPAPPIAIRSDEEFARDLALRSQQRRPRIYVAGASKEPTRVRDAMGCAREAGFDLTLDWLAAIEKAGAANEGLSDGDRRHYAADDLAAVADADFVWLLAPDNASTGAWVELGYAIALRDAIGSSPRPRIVVSGRARVRCIFAAFADYESDNDANALAWLTERSR